MIDETFTTMSETTQLLPKELHMSPRHQAARFDDSDLRASRVALYAERLKNGQDIWSGEPLGEASEEATRICEQQTKPKRGGRRPRNHNCTA